jgi:membrane protein YdbS with pleckstrin-like domain
VISSRAATGGGVPARPPVAYPSAVDERATDDSAILAITRPDRRLLTQYAIRSLAGLFLAPVVFVPLFFRYHTLKYRIDEEGISASWGILFRREVHLTYKRIQDIHVTRSIVERYLGLGTVEIQTAAGSSRAELSLEGLVRHDAVRDFLYRRMRGHEAAPGAPAPAGDDVRALLLAIRDDLAATRRALEGRG